MVSPSSGVHDGRHRQVESARAVLRSQRSRLLRTLILGVATLQLAGCQTGAVLVKDPNASYRVAGLSVTPPSAGRWWLVEEKLDRVLLSQPLERAGSARTVWVRSIDNPQPIGGYAHLHSIALNLTRQLDRTRFTARSVEIQPYNVPNAMCMRRAMRLDDRHPPAESGASLLEMDSVDILCRHPMDASRLTWIHASLRDLPGKIGEEASRLADAFYRKVRFEPVK